MQPKNLSCSPCVAGKILVANHLQLSWSARITTQLHGMRLFFLNIQLLFFCEETTVILRGEHYRKEPNKDKKLHSSPSATQRRQHGAGRVGGAPPSRLPSSLGTEDDPWRTGSRRTSNSVEPPPNSSCIFVFLQHHRLQIRQPRSAATRELGGGWRSEQIS
jgi:hypothetical protein